MKKKTLKDNGLKACENCSYWYDDGFCMQHCYYTEGTYYCPKWTDENIKFDYIAENHILSVKVREIDELLNNLYEGIDEHYTEQLEKDDELAINCAEAQLKLIKEIIDRVEKI